MTLNEASLTVATNGHSGATRWDRRTPYITHPVAVARIAIELITTKFSWYNFTAEEIQLVTACAHAHDLAEDVERYKNKEELVARDIFQVAGYSHVTPLETQLIIALTNLNKHRHANYLAFVLAARGNRISRIVKTADITHNLSDLTKGSMKDKYLLALHILQS